MSFSPFIQVDHPLVQNKLTTMRHQETPTGNFPGTVERNFTSDGI